jgi:long-chain acyl-CoA synthetase
MREKFPAGASDLNLAHLLARAARVYPARLAIARGTEPQADFARLARRVGGLAASLRGQCGLQPGDRVALFMANSPAYLELMCAIWWAGLVLVPVNAKLHPSELAWILEHSGARTLFTDASLADIATQAGSACPIILADTPDYDALSRSAPSPIADCPPETPAWLFYTSGTTGRPKGATLTHRNLMAMTMAYFCDVDSIGEGDSIIHAAPMSHGSGLYALPHLAAASTQVIPASGGFDPAEVLELARMRPGATLFAAPTMVKRLVREAREQRATGEGLRTIVYGGGPMYQADIEEGIAVLGQRFVQIYGQGESPMTITVLARSHHADQGHPKHAMRLASVGTAHTGVEVRVVDADDRPVAPGQPGEVLVRGDVVMSGYWQDPAATAKTLSGGWLHTGDLGRLDEDGFLTLMDRSKDLIISGGSNIYPREVEEVLLTHPAVAEVAVIGEPDPEWGERVCAFVVLREGAQADTDSLDRHCLEHIARFKRPRRWLLVDSLPKNNYGKVPKRILRERLQAGNAKQTS